MKKIHVARPCRVILNDGSKVLLRPGVQSVEDEVADHWYVKAHCRAVREPTQPPVPAPPHVKAILAQAHGAPATDTSISGASEGVQAVEKVPVPPTQLQTPNAKRGRPSKKNGA